MIDEAVRKANSENQALGMKRKQNLLLRGGNSLQEFHTDFERIEKVTCDAWSIHMPLTENGSELDIKNPDSNRSHTVKVRYGEILVVRGDVMHRGRVYTKGKFRGLRYFCGISTRLNPIKAEIYLDVS